MLDTKKSVFKAGKLSGLTDEEILQFISKHLKRKLPEFDPRSFKDNLDLEPILSRYSVCRTREGLIEQYFASGGFDLFGLLKKCNIEVKDIEGKKILSLGCGLPMELFTLGAMTDAPFEYYGLDNSPGQIRDNEVIFEYEDRAKFCLVEAQDTDKVTTVIQGEVDCIFLLHPIMLNPLFAKQFNDIITKVIPKILKPEGKLVVTFFDENEYKLFARLVKRITSLSMTKHIVRDGRRRGHVVVCLEKRKLESQLHQVPTPLKQMLKPFLNHNTTPLMKAVNEGDYNRALRIACTSKNFNQVNNILEVLVYKYNTGEIRLNPNEKNISKGMSALHYAAVNGNLEGYSLLVAVGGDPLVRGNDGNTAEELLEAAITQQPGHSLMSFT